MYVHCCLQGYGLSFSTEIIKISFHSDQSGLDYLSAVKIWDLQVLPRIVGVCVVLLELIWGLVVGWFGWWLELILACAEGHPGRAARATR